MRRRIALLAVLAAAFLLIVVYVKRNTFSYTNLVDEADRIQARVLLEEAGISRENIDGLFSLIEAFYQDPYPHLAEQGLQRALIPLFSYRDQDAFDHFDRQPDSSLTCRMAAFLLLKDSIRFPDVLPTAPEEKDPMSQRCLAAEQDRLRYNLLFANVEGQAVRSSEDLATGVSDYWSEVGIDFSGGVKAKLLTVYGSDGGEIQNFHTAVAISSGEEIWLLEKYDPLYPYQLSRFTGEAQLVCYLRRRVLGCPYAAVFQGGECLWVK